jgi:hypothetical protein
MPPLGWVEEAGVRAAGPGATLGVLAAWAGGAAPPDAEEVVVDAPGALEGVRNLRLTARDGAPSLVSAWYGRGEGPTIAEAEAVLGAWAEYPRPPGGPYEGVFPDAPAPEGWRVAGTLHDPPDAPGRRLVEVALLRD